MWQHSSPLLQWSGPKPRVASSAGPGASFSDLSTKSATFFRAPPRRKTSAPKGASHLPAAGEEICELELSMNDLHVQN